MEHLAGWMGATILAFCGVPQAFKTYRCRSAEDLSWIFLLMWLWGEVFTIAYVLVSNFRIGVFQWPLYLNYCMNIAIVVYLLYAKAYYRTETAG